MGGDKSYHGFLIETLKDPQEAAEYLTAAIEEGDPAIFSLALRNVIEARIGGRPPVTDDRFPFD